VQDDDDVKGGEPPLSKDDGGTSEDPDEAGASFLFRDASMAATQPDVITWSEFKPVIKKNLNKAPVTKADFTLYSNRVVRFGVAQVDQHPVHKTRMNQPWCVSVPQTPVTVLGRERCCAADARFLTPGTPSLAATRPAGSMLVSSGSLARGK